MSQASFPFQVVHSYSQKEAVFHVRGLSPGVNFTLMVYASSARGQGEMSLLQAGTVALIPHRIGEYLANLWEKSYLDMIDGTYALRL